MLKCEGNFFSTPYTLPVVGVCVPTPLLYLLCLSCVTLPNHPVVSRYSTIPVVRDNGVFSAVACVPRVLDNQTLSLGHLVSPHPAKHLCALATKHWTHYHLPRATIEYQVANMQTR